MDVWKIILIAAAVGVAFGIIGFILGGLHRKRVAEAAIGSATKEANRIVSEAMTQAEAKKKEAILKPRMRFTSREAKTKKNCAKGAMKFSARSAESFRKKRVSTRRSRISKRRTRPSTAR